VTKIWGTALSRQASKMQSNWRGPHPQRITTVVSLCREQAVIEPSKITYIHIPIPDSRPIPAQKFEDIMFAVAIGVRRGNLLVHCLAGHESVANPDRCMANSLWLCGNLTKHYPRSRSYGISLLLTTLLRSVRTY